VWAGLTLYFQFPESAALYGSNYPGGDLAGFRPLTAGQQTAARDVFEQLSHLLNVRFEERPGDLSAVVDNTISMAATVSNGPHAYYPSSTAQAGDVWLQVGRLEPPSRGSADYFVMMHEVAHALGLKHPFEAYNGFPGGRDLDPGLSMTVATYGYDAPGPALPQTIMPLDIEALHFVYGRNPVSDGDDRYTVWQDGADIGIFSEDGDDALYDAAYRGSQKLLVGLWDSGGADVLSFEDVRRAEAIVAGVRAVLEGGILKVYLGTADPDLTTASGRVIHAPAIQFVIDEQSVIEDFIGSGYDDQFSGFIYAVRIEAGGGADMIGGSPYPDLLDGGRGVDTAVFTASFLNADVQVSTSGVVVVTAADGRDMLLGIERLRFADGVLDLIDGRAAVDDRFYFSVRPDVWAADLDAELHYERFGWREGMDPSGYFSTSGYLGANADVSRAGIEPLHHYEQSGWKEGRDPSGAFDNELYLARNSDIKAAGINPLVHFLAHGQAEGRQAFAAVGRAQDITSGSFDGQFYLLANPDVARAAISDGTSNTFAFAEQHFRTLGWREGRDPNALFNTDGYLDAYADVKAAGIDPLAHYDQFGWKEGRDPSTGFDTSEYRSHYTDVANANIDPLTHYLQYGIHEGRSAYGDGMFG
jgi:hypothetical protein